MQIKRGIIKRIHVNKHIIAANVKNGRNDPAITIQISGGSITGYGVEVFGKGVFKQPKKPLKCGARIWFETKARVKLLNLNEI